MAHLPYVIRVILIKISLLCTCNCYIENDSSLYNILMQTVLCFKGIRYFLHFISLSAKPRSPFFSFFWYMKLKTLSRITRKGWNCRLKSYELFSHWRQPSLLSHFRVKHISQLFHFFSLTLKRIEWDSSCNSTKVACSVFILCFV